MHRTGSHRVQEIDYIPARHAVMSGTCGISETLMEAVFVYLGQYNTVLRVRTETFSKDRRRCQCSPNLPNL